MHLLFMDGGYEPNSPSSLSGEECRSNTSAQEREGDEPQTGRRVTKRREKNRDAARKSRQKQTERADELHEELQSLEQSNLAIQKEIAALKKELHLYEKALERHKPYCCLRVSTSSSSTRLSVSSSALRKTSSRPPQASSSTTPSRSTSLTSSIDLQTLDCTERTRLSPSASVPTTTTAASAAASSAELLTASSSSSPATVPYAISFSPQPAPHSLFAELPLITSKPTTARPVCASLVSNPVPFTAATQLKSETSPASETSYCAEDAFLMKQHSSLTALPNMQTSFSHLEAENTCIVEQDCPMNAAQLYPCQVSGNPNSLTSPCALLSSPFPGPAPGTLSVSPQVSSEASPALPFAFKQTYDQQASSSPGSLLSRLTVPSPLDVPESTSGSFDGFFRQPPPSLPPSAPPRDTSKDLSLSELLEFNEWILTGISNQ
ncbi:uncharacterized protein batf2 [Odontesthes bonariensis]|uniref:uncharacterized protein batf2 n=1 Tax=Odontesthes bonariensis TaxID=219752 RepID=UPI003F58D526